MQQEKKISLQELAELQAGICEHNEPNAINRYEKVASDSLSWLTLSLAS